MDQSRRFDGSDAAKAIDVFDRFAPQRAYVYAMGQEPWLEFISSIKYAPDSHPIVASNKLIADCTSKGIISERLFGEKEILYHIN
jgi:hypothetical protein